MAYNLSKETNAQLDALYELVINTEIDPAAKQTVVGNVTALKPYNGLDEMRQNRILEEILKTRIMKQGFIYRGQRYTIDSKTWDVTATAIHFAALNITSERNKPKFLLTFDPNVAEVSRKSSGNTIKRTDGNSLTFYPNSNSISDEISDFRFRRDGEAGMQDAEAAGIVITKHSIRYYYRVGNHLFTTLTKAAINNAVNRCEDLYRVTPNFDGSENIFGFRPMIWENHLLDFSTFPAAVDEDIRMDEIDALRSCLGNDNCIVQEAVRRYHAAHSDEDKKKEVVNRVTDRLAAIQSVVNANVNEILDHAIRTCPFRQESYASLLETAKKNSRYLGSAEHITTLFQASTAAVKDMIWQLPNMTEDRAGDIASDLIPEITKMIWSNNIGDFYTEILANIHPFVSRAQEDPVGEAPIFHKIISHSRAANLITGPALAHQAAMRYCCMLMSINEKKEYLNARDSDFGLDCGFLYFYFTNSQMDAEARDAANYGAAHVLGSDFSLDTPVHLQSTTVQRKLGEKIVDLVNKAPGLPAIGFHTVLD